LASSSDEERSRRLGRGRRGRGRWRPAPIDGLLLTTSRPTKTEAMKYETPRAYGVREKPKTRPPGPTGCRSLRTVVTAVFSVVDPHRVIGGEPFTRNGCVAAGILTLCMGQYHRKPLSEGRRTTTGRRRNLKSWRRGQEHPCSNIRRITIEGPCLCENFSPGEVSRWCRGAGRSPPSRHGRRCRVPARRLGRRVCARRSCSSTRRRRKAAPRRGLAGLQDPGPQESQEG
jgi:hypothetical protein